MAATVLRCALRASSSRTRVPIRFSFAVSSSSTNIGL